MVASQNVFTKQNIGIVAAVLVLVAAFFVPGTEVLPREGVLMLGVFGMAAALWICESLPVGITGLLALTLVVVPVSYTHLDVYKRQGEDSLGLPGRFAGVSPN